MDLVAILLHAARTPVDRRQRLDSAASLGESAA
jgi:hypothetical protein